MKDELDELLTQLRLVLVNAAPNYVAAHELAMTLVRGISERLGTRPASQPPPESHYDRSLRLHRQAVTLGEDLTRIRDQVRDRQTQLDRIERELSEMRSR